MNNQLKGFPFISICMPVRNESAFIRDTLAQLIAQDYPEDCFEIIVADGGSDDATPAIVREFSYRHPKVILKNNARRISSAGRNACFKSGKGEIFLVVDGHCYIPGTDMLKNIVTCFEKSGADCLGRPQPLNPPDISNFQQAVALARQSRIGHGGDSLIYSDFEGFVSPVSHGAVYKRHVFDIIGYVDESFDACEDVEFNFRVEQAGFRTYMSPSIAVKYYPRQSLRALFSQMTRYGKGRFALTKKHPQSLSLNSLIPPTFVLALALIPLFFFTNNDLGLIWILFLCVYLLLILCASVSICWKHRFFYFHYLVPVFIAIHLGLGYGFISELLRSLRWRLLTRQKQDKQKLN